MGANRLLSLQSLQHDYRQAVDDLLAGRESACLKFVDRLRKSAKSKTEVAALRMLTIRLSLKKGQNDIDLLNVGNPESDDEKFFFAESLLINALIFLAQDQPREAEAAFALARDLFASLSLMDRSLRCAFNSLSTRSDYDDVFASGEVRIELSRLMYQADKHEVPGVKALCLRYLAYLLLDDLKFEASLEMASQAEEFFALTGPNSDQLLLRAHMSLCYFLLGQKRNAQVEYELIPEASDHRLSFPKAVLRNLLFGDAVVFEQFSFISGRWRDNYEQFVAPKKQTRKLQWDHRTTLMTENGSILERVRAQSREGFVLRSLIEGPKSKSWLLNTLWPEINELELLEDRLDKLTKRLSKKLGGAISLESGTYRLSVEINVR